MISDHLPRYYEAHSDRTTYEVVRSIVIDGHETAWMKYQGHVLADITGRGREGEPYEGYSAYCECYFTEGVGWAVHSKHGATSLGGHEKCIYLEAAMHLRHLELRREYLARFDDAWSGDRIPRSRVKDVILDLVERSQGDPTFFIGESSSGAHFWGGYFYLQTIAEITGHFVGHLWEDVHDLVTDKKIGLEGAVIQAYVEPPPPKWVEHLRAEEDGWVATASLPGHSKMAQEWRFEVLRPDGKPAYAFLPGLGLFHESMFGPDMEDVARAEEHLAKLLDEAKERAK